MAFRLFRKKLLQRNSKVTIPQLETLYDKLIYHPEKFSFVKAIDVAVASCGSKFVEIKSSINFSSKYTDISAVEGLKDGAAEIYTNIAGIAGIEGILPDCYTEEFVLFNRESKKAVSDFFDIFNDRILSLRYSFTKRQGVETLSVPIERSVVGNIIFSLSGFDFNEKLDAQQDNSDLNLIPEQFKVSAQNLFWRNTRSSSGLKAMLSSFFKVPVEIQQFTGGFVEVSPEEQTVIARKGSYNKLGKNTFLGSKVWDSTRGININIGPLNFEQYAKFLPKKSQMDQKFFSLQKMKKLVRSYVPHGINVNLHFFLDQCLVKETALNGVNRLNKDAFIFGVHNTKSAFFDERL